MKSLIIGDVGRRFLSQWLAIQILQSVSQLIRRDGRDIAIGAKRRLIEHSE